MCLMIDKQHINEDGTLKAPLIATEDMHVYKILESGNISAAMGHYYERLEIQPEVNLKGRKTWIALWNAKEDHPGEWCVDEGYHAYLNPEWEFADSIYKNKKLVNFVIPAGAKFYFGREGKTVVASKIISGSLVAIEEPFWHKFKRKNPKIAQFLNLFNR